MFVCWFYDCLKYSCNMWHSFGWFYTPSHPMWFLDDIVPTACDLTILIFKNWFWLKYEVKLKKNIRGIVAQKLNFCLQRMLKYKKAFLKKCHVSRIPPSMKFGDIALYSPRLSPSIWMATYNILLKTTFWHAAFAQISWRQKSTNLHCKYRKGALKTFIRKSCL